MYLKKKALILSISILVVIGIVSFINIFKVGQSFVKSTNLSEGITDITDANLKTCVNKALNNAGEGATLSSITELICYNSGITSLTGINNLTGLKKLYLEGNSISGDIVLTGLTSLEEIDLSDNTGVTSLKLQSLNMKAIDVDNTSIDDIGKIMIGEKDISDGSVLNAKAEILKFKGIPWNEKMKNVILNNISTLRVLSLAKTGFNDSTFFSSNSAQFTSLQDINLSHNDLASISLTGLKTKYFVCDSCNLASVDLDKSILQELNIPNNQISAFSALPQDYPALVTLNLSGNPLQTETFNATPETGVGLVKSINLSNINFDNFSLGKLNPGAIESITMHNSNLIGVLDFTAFSPSLKYLDVSNYSKNEADYPNRVSTIKLTYSADFNKRSALQSLNVSGNDEFSGIDLQVPEGENLAEEDSTKLTSLKKLDVSFTNISNFDFDKYRWVEELNFVGCKNFRKLELKKEKEVLSGDVEVVYDLTGQIKSIGIAMSGLTADDIPKDSNNLKKIYVDLDMAESLRMANYPALEELVVVSKNEINDVTTADSFGRNWLMTTVPQNVSGINSYDVYKEYQVQEGTKLGVIPAGKKLDLYTTSESVSVNNISGYNGKVTYNGYIVANPIKVTSQDYKFDNLKNDRVIVVGQDESGVILEKVVISDQDVSKNISEDGNYLVLTKNGVVLARYKLLRVDPGSYVPVNPDTPDGIGGKDNEPKVPDDSNGHKSVDPKEESPKESGKDTKQYQTIDPTTTGAFISIVSLAVLVVAGLLSQLYMRKKRRRVNRKDIR